MRKLLPVLALLLGLPIASSAQITIPNTFTAGTTISSSQVNSNFTTLGGDALNRTGGTITGNITVSAGVTIDGIDLSAYLGGSGTPTFTTLTVTGATTTTTLTPAAHNTSDIGVTGTRYQDIYLSGNVYGQTATFDSTGAAALDIAGGAQFGSGNIALIGTDGRINGPLSTTILDDLDGTNLTGLAELAATNVYTGRNSFLTYDETDASPTISAGTLTLDLNTASHFTVALNANVSTLAVSNVPANTRVASFVLVFTADGTLRTVDWTDIAVKWAAGTAPTLTSTNGKIDVFTFLTYDGGTSWLGFVGGQNF